MKAIQKLGHLTVLYTLVFLLAGLSQPLLAQGLNDGGGDADPTPIGPPSDARPFPTDLFLRLGDTIGDTFDDAGQKISASIFESLTDRELFQTTVLGDLDLSLKVQRKVFDNQDIIDSYTVIDIMRMPFYFPIPILNEEIGGPNVGSGTFGLSLGLSFGGSAYSIRQVSPKDWRRLSSPKDIERKLESMEDESSELSEEIMTTTSPSPHISPEEGPEDGEDEDGLSRFIFWRSQNPRTRARYNKLWRLLTHPLSLPLSAKRMDKYPVGDVASYSLEGSVQLGVSAGWTDFQMFGTSFTRTQAGVGITTYLKGDFRISLWKESEHYSQVKLTRALNRGVTGNLGSLSVDQQLFEGVLIFDKKMFQITEEFIPFSFAVNKNWATQFDIGYRYDMRIPEAREAYNEAVLGRLKKSSLLAEKKGSGVTESFTRESRGNSRTKKYKMKLSLFFEKANSHSRSKTWASIYMDGVEHKLYTASNITFKAYDSLWGRSEVKRHHFLTTFNERRYRRNQKEGLGLRIEGRLEDSHTSGKELYDYLKEVEVALAKPGLFPRPPKYLPRLECYQLEEHVPGANEKECQQEGDNKKLIARYGKTSFFYQVDLTLDHLKNIQRSSKKEFWQAMEVAFKVKPGRWAKPWKRTLSLVANSYATLLNVPLALFDVNLKPGGRLIVAWRFYRGWKKLRKLKDPRKIVSAFGDLYKTMHYSPELVMATRLLAGQAEAKYYFTAKADQVFGQRSEGGASLGDIFPIGDEARRRIDFDRVGPRINSDRDAQISSLRFEKIDEDTAEVRFNLKEVPEYLYFRVDQSPNFGGYKNLTRIIVKNNGEFKKGMNTLTIKRDRQTGYLGKLRKAFYNGKYSNFLMAYSIEEDRFGPVSSVRFRLRDYRDIDVDFVTAPVRISGTHE